MDRQRENQGNHVQNELTDHAAIKIAHAQELTIGCSEIPIKELGDCESSITNGESQSDLFGYRAGLVLTRRGDSFHQRAMNSQWQTVNGIVCRHNHLAFCAERQPNQVHPRHNNLCARTIG